MFGLIAGLRERLCAVAVLVPGFDELPLASPPRFMEEVQAQDVVVIRPPNPGLGPFSWARDIFHLTRALRDADASLVHIHTNRPGAARKATLAATLARIPVVRTEHLPPATFDVPGRLRRLPIDVLTRRIITVSNNDRRAQVEVLGRHPRRVRAIHNGVRAGSFRCLPAGAAARAGVGLDPGIPVVGALGRLARQKGLAFLINAMPAVVEACGPVNLVLVGEGEERPALEAQARRLGLEDRIHFAGFQGDPIPFIAAMDVAVMPSLFEGFSIAMLELMAMGRPLVVSDHPSFAEAIDDNVTALVTRRGDPASIARAVIRLLQDRAFADALGSHAAAHVRCEFTVERNTREVLDLYREVLSEG